MMGHAEARRTEGASGGIAPTRFTLVLCVLLLVSLAAPGASALAQGQGRLVLTSNGLPKQIKADVILRGKGAKREIRFSGSRALHLAVGSYSVLVRSATARQSGHGLQKGAIAYPERKRIKIAVKSGTAAELKVGYSAVVNPGVKPLPSGALEVIGEPEDPSAIVFSARTRQLAVGTIFMAAPSPQLPRGLISKVTSVKKTGSRIRVSLRAIPVTEAVPNLEFNGSVALKPVAGASAADSLHLAGGGKHAGASKGSCSAPKLIKIGAHLDSFELRQASIGTWPPQMRLTLAIRTTESFGATAVAAGINCDWTLAELGPYQAAIPVGPVVIPVYATLPVNVGAHINGRFGAATVNVASTTVATAAAGFDENKASLTQQGSNVWTSGNLSLSGSAKLSASVGVQAGIGVVKGGNVHLNAGFGPEFDWTSGQDCELRLNLGSLSAGVTIIGKTFDTPRFTPLHPQIWSGCQSASGGGSGSSPGGGGGGGGSGSEGSGPSGGGEEPSEGEQELGTWTSHDAPLPPDAGASHSADLESVACSSTCVAVGTYSDNSGHRQALTETLNNGSWIPLKAPLPPDADENQFAQLWSISCSSICIAIGEYTAYKSSYPLIEIFSNGSWTPLTAPLPANANPFPAGPGSRLNAVVCPTASKCIVVGGYQTSDPGYGGLIETFSNGTWESPSEAPLPPDALNNGAGPVLTSINCASEQHCVAVGSYPTSSSYAAPLIETLSNGTWTALKAPVPSMAEANNAPLEWVSCSTEEFCAATGYYETAEGDKGLAEERSNGTWLPTTPPLPADSFRGNAILGPISCVSGTECIAVGSYLYGEYVTEGFVLPEYKGLVERFSDGMWSPAEVPLPPDATTSLDPSNPAKAPILSFDSVTCLMEGVCVVLGSYMDTGYDVNGLIESLVEGSWTATKAPLPTGAAYIALESAACRIAGHCVVVGRVEEGGALIEMANL